MNLFTYLFILSFVHSFIDSLFIHSFVRVCFS